MASPLDKTPKLLKQVHRVAVRGCPGKETTVVREVGGC